MAWQNYKGTIEEVCALPKISSVLEIGGGRAPLLNQNEIEQLGLNYVVNDISEHELNKCPKFVDKLCFDITGDVPAQQFDFIFSRMVFEHIKKTNKAYENIYNLLRPGGLCLNFHPTLFALPFVINQIIPDRLSSMIVRAMFPIRTDDGIPKFPASYSWCFATKFQKKRIQNLGFSHVLIIPFYGHGYFRKIPIVYQLDSAISRLAQKNNFSLLASYAYTLVQK
jgi:SAM-dependent methyltransferase